MPRRLPLSHSGERAGQGALANQAVAQPRLPQGLQRGIALASARLPGLVNLIVGDSGSVDRPDTVGCACDVGARNRHVPAGHKSLNRLDASLVVSPFAVDRRTYSGVVPGSAHFLAGAIRCIVIVIADELLAALLKVFVRLGTTVAKSVTFTNVRQAFAPPPVALEKPGMARRDMATLLSLVLR